MNLPLSLSAALSWPLTEKGKTQLIDYVADCSDVPSITEKDIFLIGLSQFARKGIAHIYESRSADCHHSSYVLPGTAVIPNIASA